MVRIPLLVGLAVMLFSSPAQGQIAPDDTLPTPSRVTSRQGGPIIDGGTAAGPNLFHSFQQFSVPVGQRVQFNNAAGIQRILTRVTGGSASTLDGILAANGTADLFFINPSGIVFGPGAQLDIGGSFVASTAEAIRFADGSAFRAVNSSLALPLLTVSLPVGLQMGASPAAVEVTGSTLTTGPGRSVALLGGDIRLNGGSLGVSGGQISLGSATAGTVALTRSPEGLGLGYSDILQFGDILLQQGASVTSSGLSNGGIHLQGRAIQVSGGSQVSAINSGSEADGAIAISATDLVRVGGPPEGSPPSVVQSSAAGAGRGADIDITAARLRLSPDGGIFATTQGSGGGGNLSIRASERVALLGRGLPVLQLLLAQALSGNGILTSIDSGLSTVTLGAGDAGTLTITTPRLSVQQGELITTASEGSGNAGDLILQVSDRTFIEDSYLVVAALTFGDAAAAGNAGDLILTSPRLIIKDGSSLIAATLGNGDGGDIRIDAADTVDIFAVSDEVEVPQINTSSFFGQGAGGEIAITAGQLRLNRGGIRSQSGGRLSENLFNPSLPSEAFVRVPGGPSGRITLTLSDSLEVIGNGQPFGSSIDASSFTAFSPGQIRVSAPTILLSDAGEISVDTRGPSPSGGQIDIQAETLILNQQGRITTASLGDEFIQGGRIAIEATTLVAIENSDISADALVEGPGGRIEILAPTIIGTQFRSRQTAASDITAASVSGDRGTVIIETSTVEVVEDAAPLAADFVDQSDRIATLCATAAESRFVVTGRGGLPAGPGQRAEEGTWQDLRLPAALMGLETEASTAEAPAAEAAQPDHTQQSDSPADLAAPSLRPVEADGWVLDGDGQVQLVARSDRLSPQSSACSPQP